jgi:hypothetical protein
MVASTALHDGEQVPGSALKVPLQLPGWIVTVALFDPDVYPLSVATLVPAVSALEKAVAPEIVEVVRLSPPKTPAMAAASAEFCPCRRSKYQVLTSIPKPAMPKKLTEEAMNIIALTPRLSCRQSEMLSKRGTNLLALSSKDTMITTSTAVRLPIQVSDQLGYQATAIKIFVST